MLNTTHVVYTGYGTKHNNLKVCLQNVLARKKKTFHKVSIYLEGADPYKETPQPVTEVSERISILKSNTLNEHSSLVCLFYHIYHSFFLPHKIRRKP